MKLRKDIEEFIESIKENDNIKQFEIEVYNYTTRCGDILTEIDKFDLFMRKHEGHEITIDNLVVNNYVLDCNLTYKDLALLLSNSEPHLINEIMKLGVSVERAIEILGDSFIIEARNELDAFKGWFEVYMEDTYKSILEFNIIPGITGCECYLDWEKVFRDYQLSSIIEIFNVDDTYIIY